MKLCIASDHRGIVLKEKLKALLRKEGLDPQDKGTSDENPVDYPDYGSLVAQAVSEGSCDRGILICSSGIGMSVVANKFPGVRAALCGDAATARQCREHVDANVLVLAGSSVSEASANEIVTTWLHTPFQGGRHQKRLDKIVTLERKLCKP
jgi:ribose 5-phosphate isomerase B